MNRQQRDASLFEIWKIYRAGEGSLPEEEWRLAIAAHGHALPKAWNGEPQPADFYWLKGVLEQLLDRLGVGTAALGEPAAAPFLHPGRTSAIRVGGQLIGLCGELHPEVQAAWDLPGRTYVAELKFSPLVAHATALRAYAPVPRFPAVVRDLALVSGEKLPAQQILAVIRQSGGELLEEVRLFDLYRGDPVPARKRSLAYSLTYRAPDRTLTDAEVDQAHGQVRTALAGLGVELRS